MADWNEREHGQEEIRNFVRPEQHPLGCRCDSCDSYTPSEFWQDDPDTDEI